MEKYRTPIFYWDKFSAFEFSSSPWTSRFHEDVSGPREYLLIKIDDIEIYENDICLVEHLRGKTKHMRIDGSKNGSCFLFFDNEGFSWSIDKADIRALAGNIHENQGLLGVMGERKN